MSATVPLPASQQGPHDNASNQDFRQQVTGEIIHLLEQGVAPWQKPWQSAMAAGIPTNPTTGKLYRGGNAIHLMATGLQKGYGDPRWMTYRQAAEHGWQVRRGEKGTHVEFWDVQRSSTLMHDDEERSRVPEVENAKVRLIHRVYTVFNARQIDGIPVYLPKQHTPFEVVQTGEDILKNSGAQVLHNQADRAFYDRNQDRIHLPPKQAFRNAASYYGTALHELAHWSGHPSRLNRPTLTESYRFGDTNYAKEELRAELASVFLAAERGIPHDPAQHAAYINSWIEALRHDKHEIFRAAHDASAAVDYLFGLERRRSTQPEQLVETVREGIASTPALDEVNERRTYGTSFCRGTANSLAQSLSAAEGIVAKALGASAKVRVPQTEDGVYRGVILGDTAHHIIQRQSGQVGIAHLKSSLDHRPRVGEYVRIQYENARGVVHQCCERTMGAELER